MGGLPALRNGIPLKECLEEAYLKSPTVDPEDRLIPNDEELPVILDRVTPCHEIVKIDHFLPGCPPSADLIWEALTALLEGRPIAPPYEIFKFD
jgi:NAD-reducing hydrogenase small subunit